MANETLYLISTKSTCDPDPRWWADYRLKLPCPDCRLTIPGDLRRTGVDVRVREEPDASAVNAVTPPGVGIACRTFLDLFSDEVARYLKLGRVLSSDGDPIDAYQTFVSEKPLLLRGGPKPVRYICPRCGRFRYQGTGDLYILRSYLTGQPIHEAKGWGLVMTRELRARVEKGRWKGIWVSKLPVRDEPMDGIDPFPENWAY